MSIETARKLADEVVESWAEGTDLLDQLSDWVLKDLKEKLTNKFLDIAP